MNPDSLIEALHEKASATRVGPAPLERIRHNARRRRRGAQAVAAASVVTAVTLTGVVAITRLGDPAEAPPTNHLPTPSVSVDPPETPDSDRRELVGGTQDRWDPRRVDDLPTVDEDGSLPQLVEPPASSVLLAESPIGAAVLVVSVEGTAQLLSTTGEWRSVPLTGRYPRLALSPGGTRLLVSQYAGIDQSVVVHDLAAGTSKQLGYPSGFEPWDYSAWVWTDENTLLLDDLRGGWLVDADTGESEQVPYPQEFAWTVDPDREVVESSDYDTAAELTDWAGSKERRVSESATGRLLGLAADAETVVGTSYDERPFSVVTADRETLRPQHVLPLVDHEGNYSNWALRVLSLRDDGTVLLRVHLPGRDGAFRVVRWDPVSGDLSVISAVETPIENAVWFASGLLRQAG